MVEEHSAFWRILVPVDGSEYSNKALNYAVNIASKYGSKVTLVHAVVNSMYAYSEGYYPDTEHEKRLEDEGTKILRMGVEYAKSEGIQAESRIVKGHPSKEIPRIANEEKYDLIVIGSRGLSGIKAFLLGSVSEKVSRFSKCPVMIVKLATHTTPS